MFGTKSASGRVSVDRLALNLDHFASSLKSGGGRLGVVEELIALLAATYDDAFERNELSRFRKICQAHALHKSLLEDPFTRRAFEKPRGYAGDAVMLDYIYRPQELRTSEIGGALHQATTTVGAARSIKWRRSHQAALILEYMESRTRARVLSVASGHLRELDIVNAAMSRQNLEIVALDQDKESLEEAVRSYGQFDIRPLNHSISYLFRPNALEPFDLIYSAGLFDYLPIGRRFR